MSMKSMGPSAPSSSGVLTSGRPSTGAAVGDSSMRPTMRRRDATSGSRWNAGRCAVRAMPPSPTTTPRYTEGATLSELRMKPWLALVGENERDHYQIQRPDHDPAIGGRIAGDHGHREQQEPDILRNPRAAADDPALPLRPRPAHRCGNISSGERANERRRPWEQQGL